MGTSTNGVLAYGYNFGAPESLELHEAGETEDNPYGEFRASWYDPEAEDEYGDRVDVIDQAILVLYRSISDVPAAKYSWDRKEIVKKRLGLWFEHYCSGDYPMYVLTTKVLTARRGDCELVDFDALSREASAGGWDEKLRAALTTLGLTPKQDRPGWLLCSYWG